MTITQTPQALSGDTIAILVQTVTKSIEGTAGLAVKVDNIASVQGRQEGKLDGVLVGLAELKQQTSSIHQTVETTRKDVADHEARLRVLEPIFIEVKKLESAFYRHEQRYDQNMKEQEIDNEKKTLAITELQKSLVKYVAIGATAFFFLQGFFSLFVVPWLQEMMGR